MSKKIIALVSSAPKKNWSSCIEYFQEAIDREAYGKKDVSYILEELETSIQSRKINKAENWLILGLLINPELFIQRVKQKGTLRSSKYNFETAELLQKIIDKSKTRLQLSPDISSYFASLKLLYFICIEARVLQRKIISDLRYGKEKLLREVLITVDFVFMIQATRGWSQHTEKVDHDLSILSAESLAEAASYIVYLFNSRVREPEPLDLKIDISNINAEALLVKAVKIRSIFEFETMIDAYGYKILIDPADSNVYDLHPPSEDFEKALRLGYVQNEIQTVMRHLSSEHYNKDGIKELGKKLYEDLGEKLITLKTEPISRYVLGFPWEPPVTELIYNDSFYAEEAVVLEYSSQEWGVKLEDLLTFEVFNGVCLHDILRAQRVINLFRWILVSHLEPRLETEADAVAQSLLPVFKQENLRELLDKAIGKNSQKLIDFLSYGFSAGGIFDLQYQPIIKLKEHYALPYNIMANSNILRNSLQLAGKRFYEDGTNDPLSRLIHKTLSSRVSEAATGINFKWKGAFGEIDNIALIDNTLFVFECKNPNLPCNPHEARNSYEYIEKAASQLGKFKSAYSDPNFRTYLAKKLDWDIGSAELVTGIIMSNRMFIDYRINGHAVRGSLETANYIETGIVKMGEEQKCLWNEGDFTGNDLRQYFEGDVLRKPLWDGLLSTEIEYFFGKRKLIQKSFVLDMEVVAKNFGFENSAKIIAEQKASVSNVAV